MFNNKVSNLYIHFSPRLGIAGSIVLFEQKADKQTIEVRFL